jgi:hypothetical protein
MPNSKHLTHGISNLVSLITKTKLGLSRLQWDFFAQEFPREIAEDHVLGDEESATRPPLNFSEAIIVLLGTEANEDQIGIFFQNFYNGLPCDHRAWVPYIDEENKFPLLFNFADDELNQDNELMMAIITPRATPVNTFGSRKNTNTTYEFYNPSAVSRQLAFGQLPIKLCFADVIKPRETITSGTEWSRVVRLPPMPILQTLIFPSGHQHLSSLNHISNGGGNGENNYLQHPPTYIST